MGVARVGVHADDGTAVGHQARLAEFGADPVADLHFVDAGGEALANELEGTRADRIDDLSGFQVALKLRFGEAGLEFLDQLGGGDDVDAVAADEFHGPGVDHGDVGDGTAGRILHGDPVLALENALQGGVLFAPAGIGDFFAWRGVQDAGFDPVDDADRVAVGWNHVIPAAGHVARGLETEDAVGEGVTLVVVEK